jgi:hypothetical protein
MELTYQRVHSGYGMVGRTPYGCCVALGFSGSGYVGLMPVVLLGNIVLDWSRQGLPAVNDVLTDYRTGGYGKISLFSQSVRNTERSNLYVRAERCIGTLIAPLQPRATLCVQ